MNISMNSSLRYIFILFLSFIFSACDLKQTQRMVTQDDITKSFAIDLLKDETYYFPAKKFKSTELTYQALQRFDLIFSAYDTHSSLTLANSILLSNGIPGDYTHMLMYIGKDSEGFAYAVEMNSNINKNVSIGLNGLEADGYLYIYCLGNDYGMKSCPKDDYIYGLERYDYIWAKRLKKELRQKLMREEQKVIQIIKKDLISRYPFQLQFDINKEILSTKKIQIIDDGHQNGGDCASYFVSLFEEEVNICLEDVRMDAATLENYFLTSPVGRKAYIPLQYNLLSDGDIYFKDVLGEKKYSFVDNAMRETKCTEKKKVKGFTTPDLIFNSQSLVDIQNTPKL